MNYWKETYAAIYAPTCNRCSHSDTGWFYILNGSHDQGTLCAKCYREQGGK